MLLKATEIAIFKNRTSTTGLVCSGLCRVASRKPSRTRQAPCIRNAGVAGSSPASGTITNQSLNIVNIQRAIGQMYRAEERV